MDVRFANFTRVTQRGDALFGNPGGDVMGELCWVGSTRCTKRTSSHGTPPGGVLVGFELIPNITNGNLLHLSHLVLVTFMASIQLWLKPRKMVAQCKDALFGKAGGDVMDQGAYGTPGPRNRPLGGDWAKGVLDWYYSQHK